MALRAEKEKEAGIKVKEFLKELTICLENIGYVNPYNKVYQMSYDLDYFPLMAALFTINALA